MFFQVQKYTTGNGRMNIFRTVLISLIFVSIINISPNYAKEVNQKLTAFKISVADNSLARKITISYHHAILEVNYEQGFIIADLTSKEISDLQKFGLKIESAKQWNKKYKLFKESVVHQLNQSNEKNQLSGIPGFDCYPTVEETLQQGSSLAADYPKLASWVDIGDSWNKANGQSGYDLMVLKITNKDIIEEKPKLFIHSSMHAREYTPAALTLDFANHLLTNYADDADIRWIVDYHEVHVLFHMNPDGRKIAETSVLQRKNTNQNHCLDSADGTVGVDLNRNFAYFWNTTANGSSGNDCAETFRGASAESEPETQAVSNYIRGLFPDARGPGDNDAAPEDTSGIHLDIHSYSELVLWPYGHTTNESPNNQGFTELGNKLAWFNDYTPMQSIGLYPTDGTSDDVSYGELGIAALTFELGTSFFQQCSVYENSIKPDNLNALIYAAKASSAPYKISFGPEISKIELNDSVSEISISQGSSLTVAVTASAVRTKKSLLGRSISKAEYSIDEPIWKNTSDIRPFIDNDGALTSGTEVLSSQVDTSGLDLGRHIIYARAYDQNNNPGVPTAIFVTISNNNSPIPSFSVSCDDLSCNFDATDSSDSDGNISNYQWDFGDEVIAEGDIVEHTYSGNGDNLVTLTIEDNSGNQASKQQTISVSAAPEPAPTPAPTEPPASNSSGGGALNWWLLSLLFVASLKKSPPSGKFYLPPSNR